MMESVQYLVFGFLCLCLSGRSDGIVLEAHLSQNEIVGTVVFTQHNETWANVSIKFNATLHSFSTNIAQIHKYPVHYEDYCSNIGPMLHDIATLAGEHLKAELEFQAKLSLSGPNSILGSSFVVSGTNGRIEACATILERGLDSTRYAVASISNNKVAGKFEFVQKGDGDTIIFGQISHSDGTTVDPFTALNWVITPMVTDELVPACPTTITVFNPFNNDGENCTMNQDEQCQVGDLTGKHGPLQIGIKGSKVMSGVDRKLPLIGPSTIVGHLLVISKNNSNSEVLACGIIRRAGPLKVRAEFKAAENKGISGKVAFEQPSPYHGTKIEVDLSGLANRTGGYHVHLFPIADPNSPSCSGASVGGHLNPFNVNTANSPKPGEGSADRYECGDLSGKYGLLTGFNSYSAENVDQNLQLYGYQTIIGRSIVIHESKPGDPRLTCSNITPKGGKVVSAKLNYTGNSTLEGYVKLTQYQQEDSIYSPTLIVVKLNHRDNSSLKTMNHNFHVHVRPVGDEAPDGVCKSCGGHYNPYDVNVSIKNSYIAQCDSKHGYRCELGDTSKKVGTYDIGGGKRFYADVDTPLIGKHTVLGRSIVFHAEEKGAPRIACADIQPDEGDYVKQFSFKGKKEVNDTNRMQTLKEILISGMQLTGKEWKLAYPRLHERNESSECYQMSFYLIDKDPSSYDSLFKSTIQSEERTYKPCQSTPTQPPDNGSTTRASTTPSSSTTIYASTSITLLFTVYLLIALFS